MLSVHAPKAAEIMGAGNFSFSIREDFSHSDAQRSLSGLFSVPLRHREIQILSHIVKGMRGE